MSVQIYVHLFVLQLMHWSFFNCVVTLYIDLPIAISNHYFNSCELQLRRFL